jgi:hypothetical protein
MPRIAPTGTSRAIDREWTARGRCLARAGAPAASRTAQPPTTTVHSRMRQAVTSPAFT